MKYITANDSSFVPASHEDESKPGVLKRVIATAESLQPGQVQMLNWARLPVGQSFNPHFHEDMQEVFVLLKGAVDMQVNRKVVAMNPGDTVLVEPREIHRMSNTGNEVAEYIVFGISSMQGGQTVVVDDEK